MTTGQLITTLLEAAGVVFIVWGYFNQNKLIQFENRIKEAIRRK